MKKQILGLLLMTGLMTSNSVMAQEELQEDTLTPTVALIRSELDALKRIKVSGYLQAQFQYGDSIGSAVYSGGSFGAGADKRFQIRRGRVKVQYDAPQNDRGISTSQYVLQFDVTERGLTIKDVYGRITDKWIGWFSLTAGMQNRPFGFEIPYSSSLRESPERGRMSQILFPGERDLGAMLTIQGPKTSNWNWLKLEAGLFNGNGAPGVGASVADFDKNKDIIGRISAVRNNKAETVKYGLGASFYSGGYRIDTVNVYNFSSDAAGVKGFMIGTDKNSIKPIGIGTRDYTKRQYVGFDGQINIDWKPGMTVVRAEYIQGDQPGSGSSTTSPNSNAPITSDIYNRKFNGAYFYFLQSIMQSPWQIIAKYDWYDANTEIEENEIGTVVSNGLRTTNATDLKYTTIGLGLAYRWDANVKFTAYYDMVTNETSNNLSGYTKDLKDNSFTLRMQVKF
jgi:hypothetical protein